MPPRAVVLKRTVEPNLRETASRGDLRVRVGEECTLLRFEQTARVIKSYKVRLTASYTSPLALYMKFILNAHKSLYKSMYTALYTYTSPPRGL